MPPILSPQEFVHKWRQSELKESSAAQEHFIDLCRLVGHPTLGEADPTGLTFAFEAEAGRSHGGHGWADVWKRGYFAWEYKGKHANLDKAYQQLLQYHEALQSPPLLIVSDLDQIIIHTKFTNSVKRVYTLTLDDLLQPDKLGQLRAAFFDPNALRAPETKDSITQKAATEFAHLADLLRKYGHDHQRIAHFLIRLLFCLFAEDIGLLPPDVFTRLVERTRKRPEVFAHQLRQLFAAMALGGWFGNDEIVHFDGGLFDDDTALDLDADGLDILARVSVLDWSNIEPSIFGTLFERGLDPSKRSQLGAHYTSKDDILLITEPVLMTPLRRRWAEVKAEAERLRAEAGKSGRGQKKAQAKLKSHLVGFANELARVRVLDPACGSGNFLYVALRQLLDLEKGVIRLAAELDVGYFAPAVSPTQLHGIEVNPYAHELAQTTVWIGYIQWLNENGFGFPTPPILKPLKTIVEMDAILAYDKKGKPSEPDWPQADVVIGNPPFLGGGKIRSELGDDYTEALFKLYGDRLPNFSDLVCYWFEKARAMIEAGKVKRAGLLATQAIRGGANRKVLERIKQTGDIFWAQSDRDWILDGATVHVSMVGFDDGNETTRLLDDKSVAKINGDLTATIDLTTALTLQENLGICFMGPSPKAPFDIDADVAQKMLSAPLNVNGRPNSDVVRPVASAVDLVQRSRGKYTIDFGLMSLEEAAQYELPFEYVKKHVYPVRSNNRRASYAKKWWQYAEARPGMRDALKDRPRFIATPEVAKHRVFVWVEPNVLCNQQTLVFAREDDYFFGVLQSKLHELWARRKGTQLREAESGFRYTPTTTFETFPFPWPPGKEPKKDPRVQAISAAARDLVQKRDAWLNAEPCEGSEPSQSSTSKRTLTNLYNQRPT